MNILLKLYVHTNGTGGWRLIRPEHIVGIEEGNSGNAILRLGDFREYVVKETIGTAHTPAQIEEMLLGCGIAIYTLPEPSKMPTAKDKTPAPLQP